MKHDMRARRSVALGRAALLVVVGIAGREAGDAARAFATTWLGELK